MGRWGGDGSPVTRQVPSKTPLNGLSLCRGGSSPAVVDSYSKSLSETPHDDIAIQVFHEGMKRPPARVVITVYNEAKRVESPTKADIDVLTDRFREESTRWFGVRNVTITRVSFPRFGGQFDYAASVILAALSNSPGLTQPSVVPALLVVEHLDVVEQLRLRVCVTFESLAELEGHRREPAFHCGVVVGVTSSAHAADDSVGSKHPLVILACVRASLVGVVEQPAVRAAAPQRLLEGAQREVAVVGGGERPAHHHPREQVEDHREVQLALA